MSQERIAQREQKVMACLRDNALMPIKDITAKTGIPSSSVFDIMKRLEERGDLRIAAIPRWTTFGKNTRAIVAYNLQNLSQELRAKVFSMLKKHPGINTLHAVNGLSFIAEWITENAGDIEKFHDEIAKKVNRNRGQLQNYVVLTYHIDQTYKFETAKIPRNAKGFDSDYM